MTYGISIRHVVSIRTDGFDTSEAGSSDVEQPGGHTRTGDPEERGSTAALAIPIIQVVKEQLLPALVQKAGWPNQPS